VLFVAMSTDLALRNTMFIDDYTGVHGGRRLK